METTQEKAIVKKDKSGEVVIFWLEMSANRGMICCNGVISENNLWSGSEASYDYYLETEKVTDEELEMAKNAAKSCYGVDLVTRHKISQNDRNLIWGRR